MRKAIITALVLAIVGLALACSSSISSTPTSTASDQPLLKIVSWSWAIESGHAIAEGEVQNISTSRLEGVTALVSYFTEDEQFITSNYALIEYNPIMPNQVSPFRVITDENPLMSGASLNFKYLGGGLIETTK